MERELHNTLSCICKPITEIESNKVNKIGYRFVNDEENARPREIKHAIKL